MKPKPKQDAVARKIYAEGGSTGMMPKQSANPQKPGSTAHEVKGSAPGKRTASGGPKTRPAAPAMPAKPGRTAPASTKGR